MSIESGPRGAPASRDPAKVSRVPFKFTLPDEVIERLGRRDGPSLRRLTPIRPQPTADLDPVVLRALEAIEAKYPAGDTEEELSNNYLEVTEAVTAGLNKRSLPPTTRLLLSTGGVYSRTLLGGIKKGVGRGPRNGGSVSTPGSHSHGGSGHSPAS